jgi:DUF438 domain-containing protein
MSELPDGPAPHLVETPPLVPPGHPVDTFRRENAALAAQADRLRAALASLAAGPPGEAVEEARAEQVRRELARLMDVEKHYLRKENLLFPSLEKHGITGPSSVMWGKHDDVRSRLRELDDALPAGEATAEEWGLVARAVAEPALRALEELIFREEHVLLPVAVENLTEAEWVAIADQSPRFGYCLVAATPWKGAPSR